MISTVQQIFWGKLYFYIIVIKYIVTIYRIYQRIHFPPNNIGQTVPECYTPIIFIFYQLRGQGSGSLSRVPHIGGGQAGRPASPGSGTALPA